MHMSKKLDRTQIITLIACTLAIAAVIAGVLFINQKKSEANNHPYYAELEAAHHDMMTGTMPDPAKQKTIAVLLYEGFTPMDAFGPMASVSTLNGYRVVTVAKTKDPIKAETGTIMIADHTLDEISQADVLIVPGGLFGTIDASKDEQILSWIRTIDKTSTYTTSVCTGSWILAAADVIDGKLASTHWSGKEYLEKLGAKYSDRRYTVDGKYITAAGISAGIDMGLALTAKLKDADAAKAAQLMMEYDPQPPFDSGSPDKADPKLRDIMQNMQDDHIKWAEDQPAHQHEM